MIRLISPKQNEVVSLTGKYVKEFLGEPFDGAKWENFNGSKPSPVGFKWSGTLGEAFIHISKTRDFSEEIVEKVYGTSYELYNFEIGERYYWRITTVGESSEVGEFFTLDRWPRGIYLCPILHNVRDIGGIYNIDGRRVKQGILYRGCAIDKRCTPDENGIHQLCDVLKIKVDFDTRADESKIPEHQHPIFEKNGWKRFVYKSVSYIWAVTDPEKIKETMDLFRDMSNPENYPAYLHCHSGMDRTGTAAFLLGLLLRVDTESLYRDYELSALGDDGWGTRHRNMMIEVADEMMKYGDDGDDIYACTEKFFAHWGLPEIGEKMRAIFLV